MARRRAHPPPVSDSQDAVSEAVDRLSEQVKVVWQALDEIRDDLQWAMRNAQGTTKPSRPIRVTSMALDPCDPKWSEKLNALRPEDLPSENARESRSTSVTVDGIQFEQAMDRLSPPNAEGQRAERVVVAAQDLAEAMEGVDQLVYCCTEPQLAWEGDPDAPSVVCRGCGFVVAEYGNIVDDRAPRRDESGEGESNESPPLRPAQRRLWSEGEE